MTGRRLGLGSGRRHCRAAVGAVFPAYEAQAERVMQTVAALGLTPSIDGAGSEDGEFVAGQDPAGTNVLLVHREEPASAREIAALDDAGLRT